MSDRNEELRSIYCGNLPEKVNEELLFELFLQAGPVESVHIPKDADGRQKPFGFVSFKHEESVPYTIALMDGVALFGRTLNIKPRTGNEMINNPYMNLLKNYKSRSWNDNSSYHNRNYSDRRHHGHHSPPNRFGEQQFEVAQHVNRNQQFGQRNIPARVDPRPEFQVWSTFNHQIGLFNSPTGIPPFGFQQIGYHQIRQFYSPVQLPVQNRMTDFSSTSGNDMYNRSHHHHRGRSPYH